MMFEFWTDWKNYNLAIGYGWRFGHELWILFGPWQLCIAFSGNARQMLAWEKQQRMEVQDDAS